MAEKAKTRNEYLDFLKGLAIILVVTGHCIQISYINFDENVIFKVIYSFHMPFFMFLAGASAKLSGGGLYAIK